MKKTILITGATDGIGLETVKSLLLKGHNVLLHGRSPTKLKTVEAELSSLSGKDAIESYVADLSRFSDVAALAEAVSARHKSLDVLINNAGVYIASDTVTSDGLDLRFVVNTIAPYVLTRKLLPILSSGSRVVNLSSAAQSPVDLNALSGNQQLTHGAAYAQSKLAITIWSAELASELGGDGPMIVAVNPASMLGSKMVKEAYGVKGGDLGVGADILVRAALSDEFAHASGKYFDNDSGRFASPHPEALDRQKNQAVMRAMESLVIKFST